MAARRFHNPSLNGSNLIGFLDGVWAALSGDAPLPIYISGCWELSTGLTIFKNMFKNKYIYYVRRLFFIMYAHNAYNSIDEVMMWPYNVRTVCVE